MRVSIFLLAILTAVTIAAAPAKADAVVFNASGTFAGGSSLTGTVTIDTTTGMILSSNLSTTGLITDTGFNVTGAANQFSNPADGAYAGIAQLGNGDLLFLVIAANGGSLVGYTGGALCSDLAPCPPNSLNFAATIISSGNNNFDLVTGSLIGTPESSTFALLSIALIGFGIFRKTRSASA